MNDQTHEPSGGSLWLTVIIVTAGFLLFGALLYYVYVPARATAQAATPVFSEAELKELEKLSAEERAAKLTEMRWQRRVPTPEERKARLLEVRSNEAKALTTYSVIDQQQGTVRLPIDRAMELTLQDLQRTRGNR
jgi:hypothetical protein